MAFGDSVESLAQKWGKPIWLPGEVAGFRTMAEREGLSIHSCHSFDNPLEHADELVSLAEENGIKAFVFNCPSEEAVFDGTVENCVAAAEALAPHGIELWMHNHYREILARHGDTTFYEAVLAACGGRWGPSWMWAGRFMQGGSGCDDGSFGLLPAGRSLQRYQQGITGKPLLKTTP